MPESYLEIQLDQQPIELCKLLKIANVVAGGGEAKIVISEGLVNLNGEIEYQKRKKIYHNDIVAFNGEVIQVVINENLSENIIDDTLHDSIEEKPSQTVSAENSANFNQLQNANNNKIKKAVPTIEGTANKRKRKPISF